MHKILRMIVANLMTATLMAMAASSAAAGLGGTLSPSNDEVVYTAGPFTGANPSNNVESEPNCDLVPGTCHDFALTVDIPAGYTAANPDHQIIVKIAWDPTNPANDFDLYIQDPVTGISVVPPAATSGNPEFAGLPLEDGVRDFRLRVLVFSVVNTSFTGTITLGPPPAGTPGLGTYAGSTDVWTCNTHLVGLSEVPGPPPTVFDHSNDGEPSCKFDPNGRMYATAIAGVPAGAGLWATSDACGQAYEFLGAVDAGAGGGDSDVETATELNTLGNYNVYMSSLTLANITTAASFDGGVTFVVTPISTNVPVDDRQWNASYGPSLVYLSYNQIPSGIECVRMDYTGLAAPVITPASQVTVGGPGRIGNLAVDQRPLPGGPPLMAGPDGEGTVYQCYVGTNQGQVFVAVSADFGLTWTQRLVWNGGGGVSYDHVFPWVTVDRAGNVVVAFSDDSNVYYAASQDQGVSWSTPVRVNRGGESRTAIFPQVEAGSEGRLAFTFYGHELTGSQNPDANWKVFVVRTQNALDPIPAFTEKIVSDRPFHAGAVCQNGLGCSCCRQLLECFEIDIHPIEGSAFVVYGSFGGGGSYITRQVKGESSIANVTVPDRSGTCPVPPACVVPPCFGDRCVCAGCIAVVDLDTEDAPPSPRADQNIREIGVAEPLDGPPGVDALAFSMRVADLDPQNLPPNGFWRIIFGGPAGQQYVRVTNCAAGGLSGDYGHFETGSVSDGPLDDFELSDDGLICMWIARDKVGNPQPGQIIAGINGDTRVQSGNCPGGPAAFAPIDVTSSGQYIVEGPCLVPVLISAFEARQRAGDGVDISWTASDASNFARFEVERSFDGVGSWESVYSVNAAESGEYRFHDPVAVAASATIHYRLLGIPNTGDPGVVLATTSTALSAVRAFAFGLTGANPFRDQTVLTYALPERVGVRLDVYNVAGQQVASLVNRSADGPGVFSVVFDPRANGLGAGTYWVRMKAGAFEKSMRLVALD